MSIPCVLSRVWRGTGPSQAQATRSSTGALVLKEAPCLGCLQLTLKLCCIRRNFIIKNVISQLPSNQRALHTNAIVRMRPACQSLPCLFPATGDYLKKKKKKILKSDPAKECFQPAGGKPSQRAAATCWSFARPGFISILVS